MRSERRSLTKLDFNRRTDAFDFVGSSDFAILRTTIANFYFMIVGEILLEANNRDSF